MENLPLLCLRKVFGYLSNLNEQIRCSSTCKKWRALFEQFRPKTLCLYVSYLPINKRLDYTNERFSNSNSFSICQFHEFLATEVTRRYFSGIRKLAFFHIGGFRNVEFTLPAFEFDKHLNHFKELEYLEMQFDEKVHLKGGILDLPKLKVLSLARMCSTKKVLEWGEFRFNFDDTPIFLKTPSLEIFKGQLQRIEFLFPDQLKHLDLPYEDLPPPIPKFKQEFQNLETLILKVGDSFEFSNSKILSDELLSNLPKLKRLIVKNRSVDSGKLIYSPELTKQVAILNLHNLKILIFSGGILDYQNWKEYTKFFGEIDHLPLFILIFKISDLCQLIPEIPPCYFSGYLNVYLIILGGDPKSPPVDQSLLLKFLKAISHVPELNFRDPLPLDQSFFDSLPDCLSIKHLKFFSFSKNISSLKFDNYRFLTRLSFGEIKFFLHRERISFDPIMSILKNKTFYCAILYFDDYQRIFEKKIANESSFREFDCPNCKSAGGNKWNEIEKHIEEHYVF